MKIYHNPRCQKSRQALQILKDKNQTPEIVEYLKEPPSKKELRNILKLLDLQAIDLVRKSEQIFKEQYKGKELSNEEWIDAMISSPKLIERPIIIDGNKAVIGRPPERVLEFF